MAKINIVQKGLSDTVQYIEGWLKKKICEFYFEFGGMIPLPSFRSQSKKIGAQNTPRRTVGSRKLSPSQRRKCTEYRLHCPRLCGMIKVSGS
jgi:hypothetical protein